MKKIICNIHFKNNEYILHFNCLEINQGLLSKPVVNLIKAFNYRIKNDETFRVDALTTNALVLDKELSDIGFYKKPVIVNLCFNLITDSIVLPKLSQRELNRYFMIEFNKLYRNFSDIYAFATNLTIVNKQMYMVNAKMCEKLTLAKLLFFINKISSGVDKVQTIDTPIRGFLTKNVFTKEAKNLIFINFLENGVVCSKILNNKIVDSKIVNVSQDELDLALAKRLGLPKIEISEKRRKSESIDQFLQIARIVYFDVISLAVRMLSGQKENEEIDLIVVNSEIGLNDGFKQLIKKTLRKEIFNFDLPVSYEFLIAENSLIKNNPSLDFIFPNRIKI